jgi:uncharacterized YccA/Bax inhibitor family protein
MPVRFASAVSETVTSLYLDLRGMKWRVDGENYVLLLLRDFGPYGIVFMNVCIIITATVMLLGNFGPCEIIFVMMCVYCFGFDHHS